MPIYKNISNRVLKLPGIGVVKPYEDIKISEGFNNTNFIKVEEVLKKKIRRKRKIK